MEYKALKIQTFCAEDFAQDILVAYLGELGYESFETTEDEVTAYIPTPDFSQAAVDTLLADFPYAGVTQLGVETIPDQDWNAEWEKNYFQPIVIDDLCVIHAPFHREVPHAQYEIIIDPKMAFGTGHHQTTSQMVSAICASDISGKRVLDMGCGTAILAMLAHLRGASEVCAIDIDQWCADNAQENCGLNGITDMEIHQGDGRLLQQMAAEGRKFDVVLANINRNILLMDMDKYVALLPSGGQLFMSGFYTEDIAQLEQKANSLGCVLSHQTSKDNWAMLIVTRQ